MQLEAVQYYGGEGYASNGPGFCDTTYQELYSYRVAGGVTGKQLQLTRNFPTSNGSAPATEALAATFAYDIEGRMTSEQYPLSGPNTAFTSP